MIIHTPIDRWQGRDDELREALRQRTFDEDSLSSHDVHRPFWAGQAATDVVALLVKDAGAMLTEPADPEGPLVMSPTAHQCNRRPAAPPRRQPGGAPSALPA